MHILLEGVYRLNNCLRLKLSDSRIRLNRYNCALSLEWGIAISFCTLALHVNFIFSGHVLTATQITLEIIDMVIIHNGDRFTDAAHEKAIRCLQRVAPKIDDVVLQALDRRVFSTTDCK